MSGQGSRSNSLESNCTYSLIDFEFRWGLSQVNININNILYSFFALRDKKKSSFSLKV